jgi:hypothetical protein
MKYKNYSKESLKNLTQYRDLSDDDFEVAYQDYLIRMKEQEKDNRTEFRKRVDSKIKELGKDYDLDDLKYNDLMQLNDLASATLALEDFQENYHFLQTEGANKDSIFIIEKLARVMSTMRSDISKIQDDLKLSKKIRKSDKEESVTAFISDLLKKARSKYESSLSYIYCPKCNELLCNTWFLYPNISNKIKLVCKRKLESGESCNYKFTVISKNLVKKKGSNKPELFPE